MDPARNPNGPLPTNDTRGTKPRGDFVTGAGPSLWNRFEREPARSDGGGLLARGHDFVVERDAIDERKHSSYGTPERCQYEEGVRYEIHDSCLRARPRLRH